MRKLEIPVDCEEMTEEYKGEGCGICGQACLAVITGQSILDVLENWKKLGLEWRGWSGWDQLKQYLKHEGYAVKQVNGEVDYSPSLFYIARVQWVGDGEEKEKPFYGWRHWNEAAAYTHFIVITAKEVFCNGSGVFTIDYLERYLERGDGVITSHMAVWKTDRFGERA